MEYCFISRVVLCNSASGAFGVLFRCHLMRHIVSMTHETSNLTPRDEVKVKLRSERFYYSALVIFR